MYRNWYIFPLFDAWLDNTGSIPEIYWNTYSVEQRYKFLCCRLQKLVEYCEQMGIQLNLHADAIDELAAEFLKFKEHGFDDYYKEQIYQWVKDNMQGIIERAMKMVFFGLNDDGRFVAYVPDSWSDLTFDTGAVFGRSDYGRLILRFEADGAIDNTYSYSNAQLKTAEKAIADFESEIKRIDATFDTLFTNLDEEVILNGNI